MSFIEVLIIFFFKQKTAYEMRISYWSSDVCSSDFRGRRRDGGGPLDAGLPGALPGGHPLRLQLHRRRPARRARPQRQVRRGTADMTAILDVGRLGSEERSVGKECVSTCRFRW